LPAAETPACDPVRRDPGGSLKAKGLGDGGTLLVGEISFSHLAIPKLRWRLPPGMDAEHGAGDDRMAILVVSRYR
jgi:hypothetical protein